jgi:hypothetical protein
MVAYPETESHVRAVQANAPATKRQRGEDRAGPGFRGFSLWRAIVYGLALHGLTGFTRALDLAQTRNDLAAALGEVLAAPLLLITIAAFSNLFSSRKIGPSVATLVIVGLSVIAFVAAVNGWFDPAPRH